MITIKGHKYQGEITPPSSKSDAHRAIISASLSNEASTIFNVSMSNDIKATIESLISLGADIKVEGNVVKVNPLLANKKEAVLQVNESGSTLRFLIPLALVLCPKSRFVLKANLINRPITSFIDAFKNQDVSITKIEDGYIVEGKLKADDFIIDGNVSSQFISGLLFALPLLDGDSSITITNTISSLNYILMTIDTISKFGIKVDFDIKKQIIKIPGNQKYLGKDYTVENDYSQAAFFLALGTISDHISIKGMNKDSYQADKNIVNIMRDLGAEPIEKGNSIDISRSLLHGCTISLDENPDLGPILFGIATYADSPTTFTNIKRLRIKESDRVEAMRYNLELLGIKCEEKDEDTFIVYPGKLQKPTRTLSSFHDHRIFMSLCVICSTLEEVTIDDEECINKSYPNFLLDLGSLRSD